MFFSRVTLNVAKLPPAMLSKWFSEQQVYASHQWLWQLFPDDPKRNYLFRQERFGVQTLFYVLPITEHDMFQVETKPFQPQLQVGMHCHFYLRANPVVTRNKTRHDVMMDAKFHARSKDIPPEEWRSLQEQAAQQWLIEQGERNGFHFISAAGNLSSVVAYQTKKFIRRSVQKPIVFSLVDYEGQLKITEPGRFLHVMQSGLGKSKALGCGLLLIKKG